MNRVIQSVGVLAVAALATLIGIPNAQATESGSTGSTRITVTNGNDGTITDTLIRSDGSVETITYENVWTRVDGIERRVCNDTGCTINNWRNDGSHWEQECLGIHCNEPKRLPEMFESFSSMRDF
jgi:hypothetical protein